MSEGGASGSVPEITTADIIRRIDAIDVRLRTLGFQLEEHSYKAIGGDANANAAIEAFRAEAADLRGERENLTLAKAAAGRKDAERRDQMKVRFQKKRLGNAKRIVGEMQKLAEKIDDAADDYRWLIHQMTELENEFRRPVIDLELNTGRTGQETGMLTQIAVDRISGRGNDRVAELVENAWGHVLEMEID